MVKRQEEKPSKSSIVLEMYSYKLSEQADRDLLGIITYIAFDLVNPDSADELNDDIFNTIDDIVLFPESHPVISTSKYEYRRAVVRKYKIVYYVDGKLIIVARIYTPGQLVSEEQGN